MDIFIKEDQVIEQQPTTKQPQEVIVIYLDTFPQGES